MLSGRSPSWLLLSFHTFSTALAVVSGLYKFVITNVFILFFVFSEYVVSYPCIWVISSIV